MVDANILIAGIVWPRWPYEVMQHTLRGDFRLILSEYILEQTRFHISRRFSAYLEAYNEFLNNCQYELADDPTREQVAQFIDLVRDPSDVPVALTAIQADADYLVSEDKDLTTIDESTSRLRQSLKVMISGTFLHDVMGWSREDLEKIRRRTWREILFDQT